jgi:hypothetical protein
MFLYFRVNVQSSALHIRLITATCILQSTVYKWTKAVALHAGGTISLSHAAISCSYSQVAEVVELKAVLATQLRKKYKKYRHGLKILCLNPVVTSGKERESGDGFRFED